MPGLKKAKTFSSIFETLFINELLTILENGRSPWDSHRVCIFILFITFYCNSKLAEGNDESGKKIPERKEGNFPTPPEIQALRATWVDAIEVRERER